MNLKGHKIPGVDKSVCNKEQKVAYNLLFAHCGILKNNRNIALDLIQKNLARAPHIYYKNLNIDLIYHYVLQSIDRYAKYNNSGILTSYEEIGKLIYSDIEKSKEVNNG